MSDPESSSNDTNAPDPRMLEELDEHIREARAAAEDAIGYEGGPSFVESGEVSSDDEDGDDDENADTDDTDDTDDDGIKADITDTDSSDDDADDATDADGVEDRTDTDSTEDDQTIAPPG